MKFKLFMIVVFSLLSFDVDAQDILKKIGQSVGNAVKKEVVKKVKEGVKNKGHKSSQQNQQETVPVSLPSEPESPEGKILVPDEGQNVVPDSTLYYIDEYGINHGGGIMIGGILWAPVNCGYHAVYYPYGKLYQWGRKHGQGYGEPYAGEKHNVRPDSTTAVIVPAPVTPAEARKHPDNFYARSDMASFNWTRNDMTLWLYATDDGILSKNDENDPCPEGWRLPDLFDLESLTEHYSEFTEYYDGGQKGRWFSGPEPYSTDVPRIFLPATGSRNRDGGSLNRDNSTGYWSLRHGGGEGLIWTLYFSGENVEISPYAFPHEANAVRCVKDIEGQSMFKK